MQIFKYSPFKRVLSSQKMDSSTIFVKRKQGYTIDKSRKQLGFDII